MYTIFPRINLTRSIYFESMNCAHTNQGRSLFHSTDFGVCAIDFHCILFSPTCHTHRRSERPAAQPSQCFVTVLRFSIRVSGKGLSSTLAIISGKNSGELSLSYKSIWQESVLSSIQWISDIRAVGIYNWRASDTLSGVTHGNRRYICIYTVYIYMVRARHFSSAAWWYVM